MSQESTDVTETEMSHDDRIRWLRSRGVIVDLPESRVADESGGDDISFDTVVCVRIPADRSSSPTEVSVRIKKGAVGDRLLESLKTEFAAKSVGEIDRSALTEMAMKQFSSQNITISESTLEKLALEGGVESFPLTRPSKENGFCGVNAYVDESGALKSLPVNFTASKLAQECGFENASLMGDVFLGRTIMTASGIEHRDFRLLDIDSASEWIRTAKAVNYDFGVATNRVSMEAPEEPESTRLSCAVDIPSSGCCYVWKESMDEIELTLFIESTDFPTDIRSRDISVKFEKAGVTVEHKPQKRTLLPTLRLAHGIIIDESMWTMSRQPSMRMANSMVQTIEMTLCKSGECSGQLWKKLIA